MTARPRKNVGDRISKAASERNGPEGEPETFRSARIGLYFAEQSRYLTSKSAVTSEDFDNLLAYVRAGALVSIAESLAHLSAAAIRWLDRH